jgi:hypothetical protein
MDKIIARQITITDLSGKPVKLLKNGAMLHVIVHAAPVLKIKDTEFSYNK